MLSKLALGCNPDWPEVTVVWYSNSRFRTPKTTLNISQLYGIKCCSSVSLLCWFKSIERALRGEPFINRLYASSDVKLTLSRHKIVRSVQTTTCACQCNSISRLCSWLFWVRVRHVVWSGTARVNTGNGKSVVTEIKILNLNLSFRNSTVCVLCWRRKIVVLKAFKCCIDRICVCRWIFHNI